MSSSPSICASPSFTFPTNTHNPSTSTTNQASSSASTNSHHHHISSLTTYANTTSTSTSSSTSTSTSTCVPGNDYFFNPKLKPSYTNPTNDTTTTSNTASNTTNTTNTITKSTSASSLTYPSQNPFANHLHQTQPTSHAPPPHISNQHKPLNDSISSLSSNVSDMTIFEHSSSYSANYSKFKNDTSFVSTDTLVEANNMNPFINNTASSINDRFIPKHKYNQSLSATSDRSGYLSSFKEEEDGFDDSIKTTTSFSSASSTSSSLNPPYPRATSAIESSFPFHQSQPLQKVRSISSHPIFPLKKQITLPSLSLNSTNESSPHTSSSIASSSSSITTTTTTTNDLAAFDSIVKNEQLKRLNYLPSQNFKPQIEKLLPLKISYYSLNEISHQIELINLNNPHNDLIIDIRPFTDFVKSHIKCAINICLPSTLLKRTNFTLSRCINSLPDYEKFKFKQFLHNDDDNHGKLIIYDNLNNSSNLFHFLNKFIECEKFNNSFSTKHISLMDSNFTQFQGIYPTLLETGPGESMTASNDDITTSTSTTNNNNTFCGGESTITPSSFKSAEINLNNYLPPLIVNNRSSSIANSSPNASTAERSRSQSLAEISPYNRLFSGTTPTHNDYYNSTSASSSIMTSTPILSTNFSLPKIKTNFKIRHNEELGSSNDSNSGSNDSNSFESTFNFNSTSKTLQNNHNNLFKLNNLPQDKSKLPAWLRETLNNDDLTSNSTSTTKKINDDFYNLEKFEQKRLLHALSLNNPHSGTSMNSTDSMDDDLPPTISCGIEYGHKNRYKDIFLYEHSRVKLCHSTTPCIEDYINASYLNPINNLSELIHTNADNDENITPNNLSEYKYIATQGPLDETMGDFWKCIINLNIPLIISLTDEIENGLIKCSAFWKSGIYKSNEDRINLTIEDEININEYLVLRMFNISIIGNTSDKVHKVLQIHFLNWPDMGTILSPLDLIQVVNLKHHILSSINLNHSSHPTLIHCSAGCGRTGTLCTIDTMINIINSQSSPASSSTSTTSLKHDPIYAIVNNFRKQRISMVQNLRQYYLIYEVLLNYLSSENEGEINHRDDYLHLNIVKQFITQFNESQ